MDGLGHQVRVPQDGHQVLAIEVVPILASLLSASVQRNSHSNSEHKQLCAGKVSNMMNMLNMLLLPYHIILDIYS